MSVHGPSDRTVIRRRALVAAGLVITALVTWFLVVPHESATSGSTPIAEQFGPEDSVAAGRPLGDAGDPAPGALERERRRMSRAVDGAVAVAERFGGNAYAAVWSDGWPKPVVSPGGETRYRLWSLSKPVTAVAVGRESDASGEPHSESLGSALGGAIRRSENCRQRQVVLTLQEAVGGTAAAAASVGEVLEAAGAADAEVAKATEPVSELCRPWLARIRTPDLTAPLADALLLGTSTWTINDAIAFTHALATGAFGDPGDTVLELMRKPKLRSRELPRESDYTAATDWGAGSVFRGLDVAYKAGWGGVQQRNFIASQVAVVKHDGRATAIAVLFKPDDQPPIDDPGRTTAPEAVEAMLKEIRAELP